MQELSVEDPRLNKPNQALVIKVEKGKLSANGAKLHLALLYISQESIRVIPAGQALNLNHMFEAPLVDLAEMVNEPDGDPSNTRKLFKKYLIEMMSTVVRWESPDARSDVVWEGMPMLSFSGLHTRDGKLWAHWQLPGPLLEALSDPSLYTPIVFSSVAKLVRYSTIALFQILTRYRHNPTGKSCKRPPEWWMDALIGTPGVDPKTKKRKPREWRKVKSEFINDAIAEINEKTDLEVEMFEHREGLPGAGRNVTAVQFAVRRKAMHTLAPPKIDLELVALYTRLGVSETLIDNHSKNFSEAHIKKGLLKLEARLNRTDLPPVGNVNTYLSKMLREDTAGVVESMPPRAQRIASESSWTATNESAVVDRRSADDVVPPVVVLASAATLVREELLSLRPAEQRSYAEAAFADLQQKGMATSSMNRSLQSNTFSGVLLTKMVDIYGTERYGKDWAVLAVPQVSQGETV